jgi:hypothetical protein
LWAGRPAAAHARRRRTSRTASPSARSGATPGSGMCASQALRAPVGSTP